MFRACLLTLFVAAPVFAAEKKPKLDLGLKVDLNSNIPKGDNLAKPKEKQQQTGSSQAPTDVSWSVVKVQHGKQFMRGPGGAVASPYEVAGSGSPFMTEKFTTVVRVKCPQKVDASIELAVLDGRDNSIMEGSGRIYFRGEKTDEADYALDWDSTPFRGPGTYKLLVKIAGNVSGTFPFRIVDKNAPKGGDAGG
ncbi:MAG: hypothetical protein JNK82_15925 [Myxococcaceae bacterium]|nr:hypothetical protein [Myxococcaceae bacterium]